MIVVDAKHAANCNRACGVKIFSQHRLDISVMRYQFTPAAERALRAAFRWSAEPAGESTIDAPQLLCGLLSEAECRAATILSRLGIDRAAVVKQWPVLRAVEWELCTKEENVPEIVDVRALFAQAVDESVSIVLEKLVDYPRPVSLATEHLLLGLAVGNSDAAKWLAEQGLDMAALEEEIHCRAGQRWVNEPLEMPIEVNRKLPEIGTNEQIPALRIIDAAANRAREGLRVVEDYVRLVLDDPFLTEQWKQLRHELTATLARFATADLLAARETVADVGTVISTPAERTRDDLTTVFAANIARLQESLRSLEEYAKTIDPGAAQQLEQLRYRSYTLHRATDITRRRSDGLSAAKVYVLIDGRESLEEFERLVQALVAAGVGILQLRDKRLDDRTLLARARRLRALTRETTTFNAATRFIMNDRPDLALLTDADGVHIGQEEMSVKDARTIVGPRRLVGVSTHSIEQARQAVLDGADYIGLGPTFPSTTKQFEQFPGLDLLRAVAAEIRLPAFAIGGITLDNVDSVLLTGIRRVAIAGAVVDAADPAAAAGEFLRRCKAFGRSP